MPNSNISPTFADEASLVGFDGDDYRELPERITARHRLEALSAGLHEGSQPWSYEHVFSPFGRLYYARHDHLFIFRKGADLQLPARCLTYLPPQLHFSCGHKGDASHLWIHFEDASAALGQTQAAPVVLQSDPFATEVAETLMRSLRAQVPLRSRYHLAQSLLALASHRLPAPSVTEQPPEAFAKLLRILPHSLHRDLSVRGLARESGYTPEYLCTLFKKFCQATPSHHVRCLRVREAARRLAHGDETIEAIAADTGFANRQHFTRVFSKEMSEPPAAFRKRLQRIEYKS